MPDSYGVINEQGFPAGQFGFTECKQTDAEKIKKDEEKKERR